MPTALKYSAKPAAKGIRTHARTKYSHTLDRRCANFKRRTAQPLQLYVEASTKEYKSVFGAIRH